MSSDFIKKEKYSIEDLLEIMSLLRSENGCPWDKEQTHESIRKNFIEETYEAVEAIDTEDAVLLKEELGDVLFQVVFHAQIADEGYRIMDLKSSGADTARTITLRNKPSTGEWFLWEQTLLAMIREPKSKDPWA